MERRGLDRIGLGVQTYRPGGWDEAFEVNSSPLKAGVIRADKALQRPERVQAAIAALLRA
jgi:hypothetical protein